MNNEDIIKNDLIPRIKRLDEEIKNLRSLIRNCSESIDDISQIRTNIVKDLKSVIGSPLDQLILLEEHDKKINSPLWYLPFITKRNFNPKYFSEMMEDADSTRHSMFTVTNNPDHTFNAELIYDNERIFINKFVSQIWKNIDVDYIEFNDRDDPKYSDIIIKSNSFNFLITEEEVIIIKPMQIEIK